MSIPSKITAVGFCLAAIGFFIAIALDQRVLGQRLFVGGFYVAVVGILLGVFFLPLPENFVKFRKGLRVGAVGFGVSTLGFLISFLSGQETWGDAVMLIGFSVMVVGVLMAIMQISKTRTDHE